MRYVDLVPRDFVVSIQRQNRESSFTFFLLLYRIFMHEVIQRGFSPLSELLPTEKHYSQCPDALAVDCCCHKHRLALRVHFRYSPRYPMESVCSKMDTQATCANDDTVERAKSLFADTLLRLNDIDGPYFYFVIGTNNLPGLAARYRLPLPSPRSETGKVTGNHFGLPGNYPFFSHYRNYHPTFFSVTGKVIFGMTVITR